MALGTGAGQHDQLKLTGIASEIIKSSAIMEGDTGGAGGLHGWDCWG